MTTKHTPGPWKVSYTKISVITAENGAVIAKVNKIDGLVNLQANARLIAAAPELLEALIECLDCEFSVTDRAAINKARAAIAKATGENQ